MANYVLGHAKGRRVTYVLRHIPNTQIARKLAHGKF